MNNEIQTLIRETAPRVTREPDAFLAALAVSEEASRSGTVLAGRRRRVGVTVAAAALIAAGGTTAAAAVTQSLWWQAPTSVVAEAVDVTGAAGRATTVTFIPSAVYAPGIDETTPGATEAFQVAQQWLTEHAFTTAVPSEAQTLGEDRAAELDAAGWPPRVALEQQAIAATTTERSSIIADGLPGLEADLTAYLTSQDIDPSLIIIDAGSGVYEVQQ